MISDAQWDRFAAVITQARSPLRVSVRLNTLRSRIFKDDLVDLLSSLPDCEVDDQGTYTAGTLTAFDGILIQNASAIDPTPPARLIMTAFETAGIEPRPVFESWNAQRVRIVIGAPPS